MPEEEEASGTCRLEAPALTAQHSREVVSPLRTAELPVDGGNQEGCRSQAQAEGLPPPQMEAATGVQEQAELGVGSAAQVQQDSKKPNKDLGTSRKKKAAALSPDEPLGVDWDSLDTKIHS